MSKRLVKTAKQQFEDRRNELVYRYQYELCETETYYAYEDSKGHFYILREQDGEYKELRYNQQYEALVLGERFLSAMSERFAENCIPVKPLFDWYASADHNEKPFTLLDIFMCDLESEHFTFEDIYEEVPDVKVVTAKEQWERESEGANLAQKLENGSVYKVIVTDGSITFFVYKDGEYFKEVYPPFEELRKDVKFVVKYLDTVQTTHDGDMDLALGWLNGGEYIMSDISLLDIYESAKCIDHVCYHDKEEQPKPLPDCITEMNMHDPFNWLREADNGTWNWIAEYCKDPNEYGYLDIYYRIINGDIDKEDEFCKDMTMEEIKADYGKRFPLLLAGVFENLAEEIRSGKLQFVMDYTER